MEDSSDEELRDHVEATNEETIQAEWESSSNRDGPVEPPAQSALSETGSERVHDNRTASSTQDEPLFDETTEDGILPVALATRVATDQFNEEEDFAYHGDGSGIEIRFTRANPDGSVFFLSGKNGGMSTVSWSPGLYRSTREWDVADNGPQTIRTSLMIYDSTSSSSSQSTQTCATVDGFQKEAQELAYLRGNKDGYCELFT